MPSQSERTFGARLRKFQDAVEYARTWAGYQPPRPQESITELDGLIAQVLHANTAETALQTDYEKAVDTRQKLFTKEAGSVEKMLVQVRGAVEAQYGKTSSLAKSIATVIATMRNSKLIKLPADPTKPEAQKTISQSEQSYGSRKQYFNDIVTILSKAPGYTASNPAITLNALQAKVDELNTANNNVAAQLQKIRDTRQARTDYYNEMFERFTRIKAYAKSQYGLTSSEYKSLMALKLV